MGLFFPGEENAGNNKNREAKVARNREPLLPISRNGDGHNFSTCKLGTNGVGDRGSEWLAIAAL